MRAWGGARIEHDLPDTCILKVSLYLATSSVSGAVKSDCACPDVVVTLDTAAAWTKFSNSGVPDIPKGQSLTPHFTNGRQACSCSFTDESNAGLKNMFRAVAALACDGAWVSRKSGILSESEQEGDEEIAEDKAFVCRRIKCLMRASHAFVLTSV